MEVLSLHECGRKERFHRTVIKILSLGAQNDFKFHPWNGNMSGNSESYLVEKAIKTESKF